MLDTILYHAWYGPFQRPIRPLLELFLGNCQRIVAGPLFGKRFNGPETTCRLGIYELKVQRALKRLLFASDVVYDIGARHGYLSLLAARCVGKDGQVYSFDPLPANADRISSLMNVNRIDYHESIAKAVTDRSGFESTIATFQSDSPRTTTLSEFVATHRHPDLIVVNAGGAETLVLKGATRLLTESLPWLTPRIWLIEVHNETLNRETEAILKLHGYRIETLGAPTHYPRHIVATRRSINQ